MTAHHTRLLNLAIVAALFFLLGSGSGQAQLPCGDTVFRIPCPEEFPPPTDTVYQYPLEPTATGSAPRFDIWQGAELEFITADVTIARSIGTRRGIAIDDSGTVFTVYLKANGPIFLAYKRRGHPWATDLRAPADYVPPYVHAGVVVPPGDSTPHIVFLLGDDYKLSYIEHCWYDYANSEWGRDTVALTTALYWGGGRVIDFGADGLGGIHVVWTEPVWNEQLQSVVERVAYAENTTGSWRTQIVAQIGVGARIQVSRAGLANLVYIARIGGHNYNVFTVNRFRGDTSWTADTLDTAPAIYNVYELAQAPDGSLHTLFGGQDCYSCFEFWRLFYAWRSQASSSWGSLYEIDDHALVGNLEVDCGGHAHVLYQSYEEGVLGGVRWYASNSGDGWMKRPEDLAFGESDLGLTPAFLVDQYGLGHAVLSADSFGGLPRDLYYYTSASVPFDAVNLAEAIDEVYFDIPSVCGLRRYDQNCDDLLDIVDILWLIRYVFFGETWGCR